MNETVPLWKKKYSPAESSNYCPIWLLVYIMKIFESLFHAYNTSFKLPGTKPRLSRKTSMNVLLGKHRKSITLFTLPS